MIVLLVSLEEVRTRGLDQAAVSEASNNSERRKNANAREVDEILTRAVVTRVVES
jgi:hypothetical protein